MKLSVKPPSSGLKWVSSVHNRHAESVVENDNRRLFLLCIMFVILTWIVGPIGHLDE